MSEVNGFDIKTEYLKAKRALFDKKYKISVNIYKNGKYAGEILRISRSFMRILLNKAYG